TLILHFVRLESSARGSRSRICNQRAGIGGGARARSHVSPDFGLFSAGMPFASHLPSQTFRGVFTMATDKAAALRDAEKLLRTGKLAQAIDTYEQIIQADPDDWETRSLVAQLHVRSGSPDTAVDRLVSAADILHLSGDSSKAAALYAKVLTIRADHEH